MTDLCAGFVFPSFVLINAMQKRSQCNKSHIGTLAAICLCAASCAFGQAQLPPELEQGLRYVEGLQQLFLLDIADQVLKDLTAKYPEAAARAATLELKADLVRGNFDAVKARIGKAQSSGEKPEILWAMKLALADSYYTYGKNDECRSLYELFFKEYAGKKDAKGKSVPIPPALEGLFTEAAYKYAHMLVSMKKLDAAFTMYEVMIDSGKLPDYFARQCMANMAEIGITLAEEAVSGEKKNVKKRDEYLAKVNKVADKLLWVQDLWFGKAIVLKAHALVLQDKPEEAQKLVDRYMGTLTAIHQALVAQEEETGDPLTRESPMAECRYLLAVMLKDKAEEIMNGEGFNPSDAKQREDVLKLLLGARENGRRRGDGAYNHFVNVYLRYPESNWAADAGEQSEIVREWLVNTFGGNVKTVVTAEQTARVRAIQYRDARTLFAQGQIASAKDRLIKVLNSFPDVPESIPALGDLARCYMQTLVEDADALMYAEMVIGHLAERFCARKDMMNAAGDELIRIAEYWTECGRPDLRLDTYGKFFRLYPSHPSCVSYLSSFAEKAFQDKDYPHAIEYYSVVAESYTNSPRAFDALSRLATIFEEEKNHDKLVAVLDDLIARLSAQPRPTQQLFSSRYRKASAVRNHALEIMRSGTTNEADIAKATRELTYSVKYFDDLANDLKNPPPSAQVDDKERAQNAKIREIAIFNKALTLTQLPVADEVRREKMRDLAIVTYEELIKDYPKGDAAPTALIQVGSIYAMRKDAEKADAALSRLRKDYPESEQAKSALPLMAENLMKLGMREQAVARYREMFASSGAEYSDRDMLNAANALLEAKEYDLCRTAIDKVLARAEAKSSSAIQARFAECRLLVATKDYTGAIDKLKAFVNDFSNMALVVDAYMLLSQAASEAGLVEKDENRRFDLFNDSISSMKEVKKRRTNDVEVAQCDIETGRIMARKAKAEAEFGNATKARDYRGKALISYQSFIDNTPKGNAKMLPLVETAFYESIPLLIDHGQWEVVSDNCSEYLKRFPSGRYASQFNAWKNQARIELGEGGEKPAAEPTAEPAAAAQ